MLFYSLLNDARMYQVEKHKLHYFKLYGNFIRNWLQKFTICLYVILAGIEHIILSSPFWNIPHLHQLKVNTGNTGETGLWSTDSVQVVGQTGRTG